MGNAKHTPGPWSFERGTGKTHPFLILGDGYDLAHCVDANDARLIAAAPELLEALTSLVSAFDGGLLNLSGTWEDDDDALMVIGDARAAIAKAEITE